jgi:hypothetical protein
MATSALSIKKGYYKAGKSFVLMFNRVSMYGPGHPFSIQAAGEFYLSFKELLEFISPVVLIYTRNQFFLEDEPLDPNLNVFKISSHFKKADISSVSIEAGLEKEEVEEFVKILLDTRSFPTAEAMRSALAARQVEHIKINHIFYQKVTEDDQVVLKSVAAKTERLSDELDAAQATQDALGLIAGKLMMEELDQGLSIQRLVADPLALSREIAAGGPGGEKATGTGGAAGPGEAIARRLAALGEEVQNELKKGRPPALADMAEALVRMKRELLKEIEARKAVGIVLDPENTIRHQAESLTDTVILDLIRREYDGGKTPVARLAFLLQRIIPFPEELTRLLPRIRECLMAEGMPVEDFAALIRQVGTDRQNEGLVEAVHRAAEEIGVDGSDILEGLKSDPAGFTRLLYLASEIEKESGNSKPLSDILVDHLERITPRLARPAAGEDPTGGEEALRRLILRFHAGVTAGLKQAGVDDRFAAEVEERLKQRLESSVAAIRTELAEHTAALKSSRASRRSILQTIEESLGEGHALNPLLRQVGASFREQGFDPNDFQKILESIESARKTQRRAEKKIDEVVFSKRQTATLLEMELARAVRYGTDLSAVAFSIYKAADRKSRAGRESAPLEATTAVLRKFREKLRTADWIGILNGRLFVAVMPMTTFKEAHLASRRLLKALNAEPVLVGGLPLPFKVAGSVVHFDPKRTPGLNAFVQLAESGHAEMAHRLRNLQDFM